MGSIRVREETGQLFLDFCYRGVRCREQTALPDTRKNRQKLRELMDKIEAEITLGTFDYARHFPDSPRAKRFEPGPLANFFEDDEPEFPTFETFAWQWYEEQRVQWKQSHAQGVHGLLEQYLVPRLGAKPVSEIDRATILGLRADLAHQPSQRRRNGLGPQTINHIMTTLRMVLREATDRFELPNPFRGIKPLKVGKSDVHPFSLEEVRLMLDHVRPDYRDYLIVRFFTGMRTAEIHGLKWRYVDFHKRQIRVRETYVKGRTETPKTAESWREIDCAQNVVDALARQQKASQPLSDYVFCTRTGGPIDPVNFTKRVWYPLLAHLGLEARRPYQTRHTAATLWLAAGENPAWIARQMGHASTEMLFRVYTRYVPNLTRNDGAAMERLLAAKGFTDEGDDND